MACSITFFCVGFSGRGVKGCGGIGGAWRNQPLSHICHTCNSQQWTVVVNPLNTVMFSCREPCWYTIALLRYFTEFVSFTVNLKNIPNYHNHIHSSYLCRGLYDTPKPANHLTFTLLRWLYLTALLPISDRIRILNRHLVPGSNWDRYIYELTNQFSPITTEW